MSWPDDLNFVEVTGIPRAILPAIKEALDTNNVIWTHSCSMDYGYFTWMNCNWLIEERYEVVRHVTLFEGVLDNQDLTAMVLRG
jgi:hypothetical protein